MTSRRTFLLGGAGVAVAGLAGVGYGVEQRALPGRVFLQRALHLDGRPGQVPDVRPGRVVSGTFTSKARGGVETGWAVLLPPGTTSHATLPLVVALHGYGETHADLLDPDQFGLPQFLAAHVRDGGAPFAIACADGGTSYWHPHDGEDAGAMAAHELVPLARHMEGVDRHARAGYLGWSMGGYGALRLAGIGRAPVVCAESPALWVDAGDAPSHGFATAAEYEKYSVMHRQAALRSTAVMVDCGTGDPFYEAVQTYVDGFPDGARLHTHVEPGGHDTGYWRRRLPADLAFIAHGLHSPE